MKTKLKAKLIYQTADLTPLKRKLVNWKINFSEIIQNTIHRGVEIKNERGIKI